MKKVLALISLTAPLYLGYELFIPLHITRTFPDAEHYLLWARLFFDSLLIVFFGYLLVFWPERFELGRRMGFLVSLVVASGLAGTSLVFRATSPTAFDWHAYSTFTAPDCWSYRQLHNIALCLMAIYWLFSLQQQYARKEQRGLAVPLRNAKLCMVVALGGWLLIDLRVLEVGPEAGMGAAIGFAAVLFAGAQAWLAQNRASCLVMGDQESLTECALPPDSEVRAVSERF